MSYQIIKFKNGSQKQDLTTLYSIQLYSVFKEPKMVQIPESKSLGLNYQSNVDPSAEIILRQGSCVGLGIESQFHFRTGSKFLRTGYSIRCAHFDSVYRFLTFFFSHSRTVNSSEHFTVVSIC